MLWSKLSMSLAGTNIDLTTILIGIIVLLLFYIYMGSDSGGYYDSYSPGYGYSGGMSWMTYLAILYGAYSVPPMFPQQLGQYARPFFGMNMGTFMMILNMMTSGRGGGRAFGRGGYGGGYGRPRRGFF